MSRKNDLARLAKVLPTSGEVEGIIDQLRDDSDMAAAVTGAAIAEARLEQLLRARLKSGSKDVMLSIFENRGPLSDFNSKILIAQALGVITTPMATELQILRAIRNAFAHAKRPLTFGVPEVEKKVRGSKLLGQIDQLPPPHASLTRGLPSTKGAYLLIVKILLIIFEAIEGHQGSADEAIGEALADHDKISSQPDGERP